MAHDFLLNVHQQIPDNLGSNQIISTLDHFLYEALKGVLKYGSIFLDCRVAHLMHIMGRDETRRSYSIDHTNMIAHSRLMEYFNENVDKLNQIKLAALDRIFLIDWLDKYVATLKKLRIPLGKFQGSNKIPSDLPPDIQKYIRPALNAVVPYFDAAMEFKSWIMQKYYRYIYKQTLEMTKSTKMTIQPEDLFQNTLLVSIRTVNKYSSNKGTLTEFIMLWLRSAYAVKYDHTIGQSYLLPVGKRNRMGETEWIDNGVARSTKAFDLEDAEHVQADMDGQISENDAENSRDMDEFLLRTMDYCSKDNDVRQYMAYSNIPHKQETPLHDLKKLPSQLTDLLNGLQGRSELQALKDTFLDDEEIIELEDDASLVVISGNYIQKLFTDTYPKTHINHDEINQSLSCAPVHESVQASSSLSYMSAPARGDDNYTVAIESVDYSKAKVANEPKLDKKRLVTIVRRSARKEV